MNENGKLPRMIENGGAAMKTVHIQITVPEDMKYYLNDDIQDQVFERNAMLLDP